MIAVTGSSGFIGRHLVRLLIDHGESVVGIDRRAAPIGVRSITCDLAAPSPAARRTLAASDGVVHLAGRPGVRDRAADIDALRWQDNVLAARTVLEAVPLDTPVVIVSSSSVYGGTADGRPSHEDDRPAPAGGYARSKVAAEVLARRRRDDGGLVTVARPFTVVGPGQRPDMALARWIDAAFAGHPLKVYGSLEHGRDVTDVDDVVRALYRLVTLAPQATINIGTGVTRSLAELVGAVHGAVRDTGVVVTEPTVPEPSTTRADTCRFRKLLGFTAMTDVAAVVGAQVDALRRVA